jgi:hypothetical protein
MTSARRTSPTVKFQSGSILCPEHTPRHGGVTINTVTDDIVALLTTERNKLTKAIEALQGPKRRGRPAKNPGLIAAPTDAPRRKRRGMSAEARKALSARMKRYWAARRKAQA